MSPTLQLTGLFGSPALSWEVARGLPQVLIDWRLGIVSVSLLTLAAATLTIGWIAGAVVLRRVLGRRRPAPASLQEELASLAAVIGCRVPRLTLSDTSNVPAAVGLSEVCVPGTSFGAMSPAERRTLLAHEMGHLVARDPLWFAVAGNLARLTAFQPLNRWAIARLRVASEEAADDFSVKATGDPFALARALVGLASMLWVLPGGAAASGSPIVARVGRLLNATHVPAPSRRPVRQIAALVALAAMLFAAPGFHVSIDDVANRLPWLAPSQAEMVAVVRADTDNGRSIRGPSIWQLLERLVDARQGEPIGSPRLVPAAVLPLASNLAPRAQPVILAVTAAERARLIGNYEIGPAAIARVFEYEGRLFMSIPMQGEAEIFATGSLTFTLKAQPGVAITFQSAADGRTTGVEVMIGRQKIQAMRR